MRMTSCKPKATRNFIGFSRLKREEGGGSIIIQAMALPRQPQPNLQSMDDRPMDHDEKKMRRQIANSNERRRMQSINAGFQSLRQLLPHHEGEKLSKVSKILVKTTSCKRISYLQVSWPWTYNSQYK